MDLSTRFELKKSEASAKNKWLVVDHAAPACEDAVIYRFPTKKAAIEFRAMMIAERA